MELKKALVLASLAAILTGCGDSNAAPPAKAVDGKALDQQQSSMLKDDLPGKKDGAAESPR